MPENAENWHTLAHRHISPLFLISVFESLKVLFIPEHFCLVASQILWLLLPYGDFYNQGRILNFFPTV